MKWNRQCLVYLVASYLSSFFLISSLLFFNHYILYIFVFFPVHRTRVILLQVTSHWISTLMNRPSSCLLTGVTTSVRPITAPSPWNHRPTTRISAKRIPIRRLTVTSRPTNVALPCIIASSNLCSRKFWAKKKPGTAPSKPNYLFPAFLRVHLVLLIASFFLSLSLRQRCKEHREATKQMSVWRLPEILTIQLKRFSFRNLMWRDKIDQKVHFPVEYVSFMSSASISNAMHANVDYPPCCFNLQTVGFIALLVEHHWTRGCLRSLCGRQSLRRHFVRSLHIVCPLPGSYVWQEPERCRR